jgi:hypothetical protein
MGRPDLGSDTMLLETERSWDHKLLLASCLLRVEVHGLEFRIISYQPNCWLYSRAWSNAQ